MVKKEKKNPKGLLGHVNASPSLHGDSLLSLILCGATLGFTCGHDSSVHQQEKTRPRATFPSRSSYVTVNVNKRQKSRQKKKLYYGQKSRENILYVLYPPR